MLDPGLDFVPRGTTGIVKCTKEIFHYDEFKFGLIFVPESGSIVTPITKELSLLVTDKINNQSFIFNPVTYSTDTEDHRVDYSAINIM